MKLSTHFRMGPIPLAQRISASMSLKRPNNLPAVVQLNELDVLSTKSTGSLEMRMTTPAH